ncbi:MAG: hypothetical protein U9Q81_18845 [Pseudomonadota bacterium]|nr:hypothetical protein [Pseudomonadota bacterium]
MDILIRALVVATAVLVAYSVISFQHFVPEVKKGMAEAGDALVPLEERLIHQLNAIEALQSQLTAFQKELRERAARQEQHREALRSVKGSIATVMEADNLRKKGTLPDAADLLLSTKDPIWKAGDIFTADQNLFRSLMGPIDVLAGKWREGDAQESANDLVAQLQAILDRLSY